jgi:glycogen(starch) synthase
MLLVGAAATIASVIRRTRRISTRRSRTRPRVLHLGFEDPLRPGAGGASMRTHEISRRLAQEFEITIVCASYAGARPRTQDGVRYVHVGLPLGYFGSLLSYFAALPWALWRYDSELVVEDFAAPFSSAAIGYLSRRPVLGVAQWLFASDKTRQYHLPFHVVEQIGLRSHRRIIAVSEGMADAVRTRNPMATVTVIPAGLPDEAFEDWAGPRRDILYLGRLEMYGKGLDLLLYAFAKIADQVPQGLVIAGDGPDRHALEALASALGLRDRVRFVGWIPRDERFKWLSGADFIVMPSLYESFGLVAAEALAVNTPVVAFDIPCLREIVGTDVGAVVPKGDVDALAKAMWEMSVDPDRRATLGAAGRAKVAHLNWDVAAEAQGAIYREMTENKTPVPVAAAVAPCCAGPN